MHHDTLKNIADRLNVSPRDVLDAAIDAGCRLYHLNGQRFHDPAYLKTHLALEWLCDPIGDVECSLTDEQLERLAGEFECEAAELMFAEVRS